MDFNLAHQKVQQIINQMENVIKGKRLSIEYILTCLFAKGHILIEDNPGSGKTITAKALAATINNTGSHGALFKRIQFTPDLLPMDLIGSYIFDDVNKDFIFKKGPLFSNVVLADEINRASPKVQSALLESMAEQQITVGDTTYALDKLFFVMATQNPIDLEGTYPLPAAQLDRFMMKIDYGYVAPEYEMDILTNYSSIFKSQVTITPVIDIDEIIDIQNLVDSITIHPELIQSILNIITATRNDSNIRVGASTRAGISFLKCLKAYALIQQRTFVTETDIEMLGSSVLQHRLSFKNQIGREESLKRIIHNELKRLSTLKIESVN